MGAGDGRAVAVPDDPGTLDFAARSRGQGRALPAPLRLPWNGLGYDSESLT